ncbi:SagB/ThcOx family dehydrogenase [Natranaerofaba carboxydovora]|uniref:SagB/ThcOx family dehydrogenase n=1 Tax=Natranaerofaba carboxydovora TaxID=2742683 RepID=UPI001F1377BC|nr:SagB/ThcOx family dehydrogenase [Natranaerofaba carboxydovora]UMZ74274.1 Nitroreductase family protein [Natranaerofaba carboxydovora]
MKRKNKGLLFLLFIMLITSGLFILGCESDEGLDDAKNNVEEASKNSGEEYVSLSDIEELSEVDVSIQETIENRRSIRSYQDEKLDLEEISYLMWAAQGITDSDTGYRAAPSAGATFPMEVYVVVGDVEELSPGIYRYLPEEHELQLVLEGDFRDDLMGAALGQAPIGEASINIVITSIYERVMSTYGERGIRYAKIEAGHISQNIFLLSTALELGTVSIGAFEDEDVADILQLEEREEPLYIMPVGRR